MKKYLFLMMSFIFIMQKGFCETAAVNQDLSQSLKVHSNEPGIFTIVIALLFVICLIYITGLIYSKLNIVGANTVKKQMKNYDLCHVAVLSTTQLGQNRNLHVVEVDGRKLLVGATQNSINLIKDLSNLHSFDDLKQEEIEVEIVENFDLHKKYL